MTARILQRDVSCKSALNRTGIPGYDYCLNPYGGCTHACVYCYASFICRFSAHERPWGEFLDVKANFPEVLARQLRSRRRSPAGRILLGTVTDVYQPAEEKFRLTRSCLEILSGYPSLEIHILTKSALVRRDIAILRERRDCQVGFTVTTVDPEVAGVFEPGASSPKARLEAAAELRGAGISVWVFVAPLLPGITDTDESLDSLRLAIRRAGVKDIQLDCLNPYPAIVGCLLDTYRDRFPGATGHLEAYLRNPASYKAGLAKRIRLRLQEPRT